MQRFPRLTALPTAVNTTLVACSLAACSALPEEAGPTPTQGGFGLEVSLYYGNSEFDTIEFDDPGFAVFDDKDVRRERAGAELQFGTEAIRGVIGLFSEDFMGFDDGAGVLLGVEGRPVVYRLGSGLPVILPYRLTGSLVNGNDATIDGQDGCVAYWDAHFELGVGLDFDGLQPAIGVTTHSLGGHIDFDGESNDEHDDEDLEGDSTSGYLELAYRPHASGWRCALRGVAGDETGAAVQVSWGF